MDQLAGETRRTSTTPERGAALLTAAVLAAAAWYFLAPYTVDDAFISFRYAEHFAAGDGLVYNLGQRVEGYTNFLWVVLLAGGSAVGVDTLTWCKGLGFVLTLLCLVPAGRLALRISGSSPGAIWLTLLAVASSPIFITAGVDGLETQLFTLLLLAGVDRYLVELDSSRRFPWSALLLLGVGLTRPDGVWMAAVVGVHRLLQLRRVKGHAYDIVALLLYVVPGVAYFLWRWWYYGHLLPNTFYAKGFATGPLIDRGLMRLAVFVLATGAWWLLALPGLRWQSAVRRGGGLLLAIVIVRLAFAVLSGGAWMGYHRFFAPALPFIYILAAAGVAGWLGGGAARRQRWLIGVTAFAVAFNAWWTVAHTLPAHYRYTEGLQRAHLALGRWLADHAGPGSVLACGDAGALPYYARLNTIDILGLNDDHLAHLPGGFYGKLDADYILNQQPDYVVLLSHQPDVFNPRTPISGLLGQRLSTDPAYRLWTVLRFDDTYWLWVIARDSVQAEPPRWGD